MGRAHILPAALCVHAWHAGYKTAKDPSTGMLEEGYPFPRCPSHDKQLLWAKGRCTGHLTAQGHARGCHAVPCHAP